MWFENLGKFFKNIGKTEVKELEASTRESKETAKERLHMVLMQDRANVSADFLELMKQEIIDVIKKYIEVDENTIDVRLTTKTNEDGTIGSPSLYANIPILNIRNDMKVENYKFALQSDGSIIAQKIEEEIEKSEEANDNKEEIIENNVEDNLEPDTSESIEEGENIQNLDEELANDPIVSISENNENIETEENNSSIIEEIMPAIEKINENITNNEIESSEIDENKTEEIKYDIPLKKSARRGRPKKKDKKGKHGKRFEEENFEENEVVNIEENEEDDDDVTFDDLLKAAEEEDRKKAEQEKKEG